MKFKLTREEMKQICSGDAIRQARNEVCLTQEYIAEKLGLSQSTYQRIEKGEINISMDRLIQIAEILDKPVDYFLKDRDQVQQSIYSNKIIYVSQSEWELMKKIILQQEKRIEELEQKLKDQV